MGPCRCQGGGSDPGCRAGGHGGLSRAGPHLGCSTTVSSDQPRPVSVPPFYLQRVDRSRPATSGSCPAPPPASTCFPHLHAGCVASTARAACVAGSFWVGTRGPHPPSPFPTSSHHLSEPQAIPQPHLSPAGQCVGVVSSRAVGRPRSPHRPRPSDSPHPFQDRPRLPTSRPRPPHPAPLPCEALGAGPVLEHWSPCRPHLLQGCAPLSPDHLAVAAPLLPACPPACPGPAHPGGPGPSASPPLPQALGCA